MPNAKNPDLIVDITALTALAQALADGASVHYDAQAHVSICGVCQARIYSDTLDLSIEHQPACLVPQAIAALNPIVPSSIPAQGEE